jgi:DNA polymerase III subunit delta
VIVRQADKLREEPQKALLGVLDGLPDGTHVVLTAGSIDLRRSFFAEVKARGWIERHEATEARDAPTARRDLLNLVGTLAAELSVKLAPEAADALVEFIGNDPSRIAAELEKIALRFGDRPVDKQQLLDGIGGERALAAFALEGAVRERRVPRAIAELRRSLAQGERPEMLIGQIAGELRALLRARALLDAGLDEDAAKRAFGGGRGYFVVPNARRFRREELERALAQLGEADLATKTGGPAIGARLERLLLGLAV